MTEKKGPISPDEIALVNQAGFNGVMPAIFQHQMPCFGPLVVFLCWYTTYVALHKEFWCTKNSQGILKKNNTNFGIHNDPTINNIVVTLLTTMSLVLRDLVANNQKKNFEPLDRLCAGQTTQEMFDRLNLSGF
jgi:hypothetical protein